MIIIVKISDNELEKISGGISGWAVLAIVSAVVFLAGVLEGIVYPKGCNT